MSVSKDNRTLLVIVSDEIKNKKPGGVQLKEERLFTTARSSGVSVILTSTKNIHRDLSEVNNTRVVIYVQKNGRLSSQYRDWAYSLLRLGYEIIEVNIFALASRYRPINSNYTMALMSVDGAYRYSYRSFWSGLRKSPNYILLPNPNLFGLKNIVSSNSEGNEFTFLRIGRPDPIKWSEFEIEFVQKVAELFPTQKFVLDLVGYPMSQFLTQDKSNLEINVVPYLKDPSSYYAKANCYVHHSAIGESFGNTISEAAEWGIPILYAADLYWDQAPLKTFDSDKLLWSTPNLLLKNAKSVFIEIEKRAHLKTASKFFHSYEIHSYLNLLMANDKTNITLEVPKSRELFKYFLEIRKNAFIQFRRRELIFGLVLEGARAFKNRWKKDL